MKEGDDGQINERSDTEGEGTEVEDAEIENDADLTQTGVMLAGEPSSREANFFNMQVAMGSLHF